MAIILGKHFSNVQVLKNEGFLQIVAWSLAVVSKDEDAVSLPVVSVSAEGEVDYPLSIEQFAAAYSQSFVFSFF